jgi:carbon-monoxide dehydrogenase small subunit
MSEEEKKIKPEEKEKSSGQISRREFLRDAGLVVGGATIGSMAILSACGTSATETVTNTLTKTVTGAGSTVTATVGGATVTATATAPAVTKTVTVTAPPASVLAAVAASNMITLNVNGANYTLYSDPAWTLQWVLNDRMSLIGVKDWCDQGACGSCTVNIDGRSVLSCMILAVEAQGKKIETVEGIAAANHPLIQAYIDNWGLQCGYCTPGLIVTAKALLDVNKNPTEAQIKEALGGNLCRCSVYLKQPKCIMAAAAKLGGA